MYNAKRCCTLHIQYDAIIIGSILSLKTLHSSPIRERYGVSFVDPASDWYSAWVPVIIYVISYSIGPCCILILIYQRNFVLEYSANCDVNGPDAATAFVPCWIYINNASILSHNACHQTSDLSHTLVAIKIVDHSDVVGASPVGTAPTTSSFST